MLRPAFQRSEATSTRGGSVDDYHSMWGAEAHDPVWSGWLKRSDRMEFAPLPDGTLRRRGLREALAAEWASVAHEDALAALRRVRVPVLVVHANADWGHGPYVDDATIRARQVPQAIPACTPPTGNTTARSSASRTTSSYAHSRTTSPRPAAPEAKDAGRFTPGWLGDACFLVTERMGGCVFQPRSTTP